MIFLNIIYATTTLTIYTSNNYELNLCTIFLEVEDDLSDNVKAVLRNDTHDCDLKRVTDLSELLEIRDFLDSNYKSIFMSSFPNNFYTSFRFSLSNSDKTVIFKLKDKLFEKNYQFSISHLSFNAIQDKILKIKEECIKIKDDYKDDYENGKWEIKYVRELVEYLYENIDKQLEDVKNLNNYINCYNINYIICKEDININIYNHINENFNMICRHFEDIKDEYNFILYYKRMYIENTTILEEDE